MQRKIHSKSFIKPNNSTIKFFFNINELANALKPIAMPGEEMSVFVVKEGKEAGQGIGYMDDGTMIVIENGRRLVGETVDVTVTSVLQTSAGRMIFARVKQA